MGLLRSIFGGNADSDWLKRVAAMCERIDLGVVWTHPDHEIEVRPGHDPHPTLWLDSHGRVEVAPFEGDVDHPGFRLHPRSDPPDVALQRIVAALGRSDLEESA